MNDNSNARKGILFAALTALMWGFLAIVLKVTLTNLNPVEVTWFRFTSAFLILFLYLLLTDKASLKILINPPLLLILASCFLGLNYLGFISGIDHTTPAIAQIFIQTGPVLLAMSGFIFFKEKASHRQIVGLFLVFLGLIVFYRNQILAFTSDIAKYQNGVLLTLFGAVMWAGFAVLQKKLVANHHPMHLNLVLFGLPALGYTPFVNFKVLPDLSNLEWGLLLFLGLNTLLAYGSLAYAFKFLEANKVSVIITLNPILTFIAMAILGVFEVTWIMHENFTVISVFGALFVIAGAVLTILKSRNGQRNIISEKTK
ncbi:MAG: DMT family transporter [Bacteroidales bacterium]|nr:DMT family transporter [Bacteroidales bacterium]